MIRLIVGSRVRGDGGRGIRSRGGSASLRRTAIALAFLLVGGHSLGWAPAACSQGGRQPLHLPAERSPDEGSIHPESEEPTHRPGRDDPDRFYRPPPRAPKQRTQLYAQRSDATGAFGSESLLFVTQSA